MYKPLKRQASDGVYSVRLLTLLPGENGSPICCKLRNTLIEAPENTVAKKFHRVSRLAQSWFKPDRMSTSYEALSWVWGDLKIRKEITVNGQKLEVTTSLMAALEHLRDVSDPRELWVDAICINQRDLEERNQQIQIMEHIYSFASTVLVWLGERNEYSDKAFDLIEKFGTASFDDLNLPDSATDLEDSEWTALYKTLDERSWWRRVWVVQEFCHGRKVLFMCGNRSVTWEMIARTKNNFKAVSRPSNHNLRLSRLGKTFDSVRAFEQTLQAFDKNFAKVPQRDLQTQLECFATRSGCTDPRDRIYALLSISTKNNVVADYFKSTTEVYIQTARAIIEERQDLVVLSYTYRPHILGTHESGVFHFSGSTELPSWTPNWSAVKTPIAGGAFVNEVYHAAGGTKISGDTLLTKHSESLFVRGILYDIVEKVESFEFSRRDFYAPFREFWKSEAHEDLRSIKYPTHEVITDVFWRTLIRDRCILSAVGRHRLRRLGPQQLSVYRNLINSWSVNEDTPVVEGYRSEAVFREIIREWSQDWKFFKTHRGYFGQASGASEMGDVVAILYGCPFPVMIRPCGTYIVNPTEAMNTYTLVGHAYVHGLMDGEAMEALSHNDVREERIVLV